MPDPQKEVPPNSLSAVSELNSDLSLSQKVGSWLKKHYLHLINIALAIYLFLPFLAPILMKVGQTGAADAIYRFYKPLCHQLAYRSFFLFGEQSVYPRAMAGIEGLITYEEATGLDDNDLVAASAFRGNEQVGYKIALCQRDVAIYGGLLVFGLIFSLSGRKIKPLPWIAWLVFAIVPMGLDGLSQLISQMEIPALSWFAMRESTPFLRAVTGAMFGWFTAWFGMPSIDEMINEETQPKETLSSPSKGA